MTNEHNQIVCDQSHIILNDGVTICQGYLSVEDGKIVMHLSDDPNNKISYAKKPALTRNRVKYLQSAQVGTLSGFDGTHFRDKALMDEFLVNKFNEEQKLKIKQSENAETN